MEEKENDYTKKIKDYQEKIDALVGKIKEIEKKPFHDWEKSDEIMKLLRNQDLYIHPLYIREKFSEYIEILRKKITGTETETSKATLDFNNQNIKFTINEDEKKFYYELHANSFGPFNPEAYFKSKIRILWLLKEPLIVGMENWIWNNEYKGPDRGGHDQAKEYNKWETIKGTNYTKERVVKITKKILSIIDKKGSWDDDSDETYQKVMDHICILEVQHFPGLAFSGTSTDPGKFGKWAKLNKLLVEELVQFYTPRIIIGGHTLKYFFPSEYGTYKHYKDNIYKAINKKKDLKVFGNQLINHCDDKNNNWIYINENGQILIDADHPCLYNNYTDDHATADGNEILKLMNQFSKQPSI